MLKNWDKEVAYSTININIYERTLPTSKVQTPFEDFGRRIREAFIQSVNYLLKLIVDASIMIVRLMPFAVVAVGTVYIVRILLTKYKK
jgi:L-cystine uptake protein TcyP (sodium:dicarboxylate symporter family)